MRLGLAAAVCQLLEGLGTGDNNLFSSFLLTESKDFYVIE